MHVFVKDEADDGVPDYPTEKELATPDGEPWETPEEAAAPATVVG